MLLQKNKLWFSEQIDGLIVGNAYHAFRCKFDDETT